MARINGREFSQRDLTTVFDVLNSGGRRADVRDAVQRLQGRGIANETIRKLRDVHRTLMRSKGIDVKQGGTRGYVGEILEKHVLPDRRRLSPLLRPAPPDVVATVVQVAFFRRNQDGEATGVAVGTFELGPGSMPLADQLSIAETEKNFGTNKPMDDTNTLNPGKRGYQILKVSDDD